MELCLEFRRVLFRSGMLMWRPEYVSDIGWQLSMAATAGLILEIGRGAGWGRGGRSGGGGAVKKKKEDKRDGTVSGVQTCALPIWNAYVAARICVGHRMAIVDGGDGRIDP